MPDTPTTPASQQPEATHRVPPGAIPPHTGHASPFQPEAQKLKRSPFAVGAVDEFGIPLNSGAQYDPITIGVKDEQLAVFPAFLAELDFPFLPTPIVHSLGYAPLRTQDVEHLEHAIHAYLSNIALVTKKIKPLPHLSKGYYAGQVPEVLFAYTGIPEVEATLIEELAIYAEKLLRMGFILPQAEAIESTPSLLHDTAIHRAVPCIVLVGNGFHYQRFLKAFQARIDLIALDEEERKSLRYHLLGRVLRGAMVCSAKPASSHTDENTIISVQPALPQLGYTLHLAGGNKQTQRQLAQVFQRMKLAVHIEQASENPAERLELQQLFDVVHRILLPWCYSTLRINKKKPSLEMLQAQWRTIIFNIGVHRKAFSVYETDQAFHVQLLQTTPIHTAFILNELREFMPALKAYCEKHSLLNNTRLFDYILPTLESCL
jgi:hypothetical protein